MEEELMECFICGRNFQDLDIHHINGDHSDDRNANRIKICSGCHHYIHQGGRYIKSLPKRARMDLHKYRMIIIINKKKINPDDEDSERRLKLLYLLTISE